MRDTLSEIIEIDYHDLLEMAIQKKREGYRLSQACAAYVDGKPQLSYSFADDENYKYITLRCKISLSEVIPYAAFYENEMRELFGINISLIEPDYKNKLYRITKDTPFAPEEGTQA